MVRLLYVLSHMHATRKKELDSVTSCFKNIQDTKFERDIYTFLQMPDCNSDSFDLK